MPNSPATSASDNTEYYAPGAFAEADEAQSALNVAVRACPVTRWIPMNAGAHASAHAQGQLAHLMALRREVAQLRIRVLAMENANADTDAEARTRVREGMGVDGSV